ncbi:MAG: DinB family protein [Tepidiformaceae bacterium]
METASLAIDSVRFFESFQAWAMERVLDAARRAGTAADAASIPGSNGGGTVQGLLGHMVDADIHWLNRWLGNEHSRLQMPGAWRTVAEVEAAWRADQPRRNAFFADLDEERLRAQFGFYRGDPPAYERYILWQTILHAHNHATHHRAEVSALLTTAGFAPEGVDMFEYLRC